MEMNQETIYSLILIGLMLLGIVLSLFVGKPVTSPVKLHKRVYKVLNGFARPRKFRVLEKVTFETKKGPQTVDHVLVGYFGVLFVNDLLLDGDYYGEMNDEKWICNKTNRQDDSVTRIGSVENPLRSASACMEAAVDMFARHNIYNLPMDVVAVKAFKKGDFLITGSKENAFTLRGLRSFFLRSWFEKDTGLEVQQICDILTGRAKA